MDQLPSFKGAPSTVGILCTEALQTGRIAAALLHWDTKNLSNHTHQIIEQQSHSDKKPYKGMYSSEEAPEFTV